MRKKLVKFIIVGIALVCASCNNNPYDLSNLKKVEADGEWGIPLFNSKVTLDQFLQKLDSVKYLHVGDDGTISFAFESDEIKVVQGSDIIPKINTYADTIGNIPSIPSPVAGYVQVNLNNLLRFNINNEYFIPRLAAVESGNITISFSLTSQYINNYSITLTSPQITTSDGQNLSFTLTSSSSSATINLAGCTIRPNSENLVAFNATLALQHPGGTLPEMPFHATINVQNLSFLQVIGILNSYSANINNSFNVKLPLSKVTIENMRFYDPQLTISTQNSFCNASSIIESIQLLQDNGSTNPLISQPVTINIPYSSSSYMTSTVPCSPSIVFDSHTDSIRFRGNVTLNPQGAAAGNIRISKSSDLHVKMKAEMPGNLSLDNAVYRDTMNNALYNKSAESITNSIERIQLRMAIINDLPMEFTPELSFIDTVTHEITNVDLSSIIIHGSYDGQTYVATPAYVNIDGDKIHKITAAHKMVMCFRVSSANHIITINKNRFIHAQIGAKIQYSEINL